MRPGRTSSEVIWMQAQVWLCWSIRMVRFGSTMLVLILPLLAFADDKSAAKSHFEQATKLYDLGRFAEAAKEYERAYELHAEASILFNLGQAYRFAGDRAS